MMKGFYCFALFACFYILLTLLLRASAQSNSNSNKFALNSNSNGNGIGNQNIQNDEINSNLMDDGNGSSKNKNVSDTAFGRLQQLLPSSLSLDKLGITDPYVRQSLTNVYGTLLGQPECVKKSMCVMGNYLHDMPARDIVFTLLGRYVPPDWGLLYDIFRVSVMYGQNCEVYFCNPQDLQSSSASGFPANSYGRGNSNPKANANQGGVQQQQFASNFDNQIHKENN